MFGMGTSEILIVLLLAAIVVLAVLPGAYDIADETVVPGVSFDVADQVLFRELSDLRSLTMIASHGGSFTLSRTSRPWWAFAAAVVLFPVGLVFLLWKRDYRIQVSVSAHPDGCRVRIVGRATRRDVDEVAAALKRVLPVPDIVVR